MIDRVIGTPSHFDLSSGSIIFIPLTTKSVSGLKTGIVSNSEKNKRKSPIS